MEGADLGVSELFPIPDERVDERDTMFARSARRPGTGPYGDYYAREPGRKAVDDRIRSLPELGRPGGRYYDPGISPEADHLFESIEGIQPDEERVASWSRALSSATDPTGTLRTLCLSLGAVSVGAAPVDPAFVYTHKGRLDEDYGEPVRLQHPGALVFLLEMDHETMQEAPRSAVLLESARQYYRAAEIGKTAAAAIRAAGYDAKAHYDAHYDVILPPLAIRAGLGELGRHNILIAPRFGTRVRIGAVTTDLPLRHGSPVDLGVRSFCEVCSKCARSCPPGALSSGRPAPVRGVEKWPTDTERCYAYWRAMGTDCGICMTVCPFSHPDGPFHNLVRWVVRTLPFTHRLLSWFDDLVYGRAWDRS
ncbi:MAG: reductive dehalogenase domain-containing protein [bacterium]